MTKNGRAHTRHCRLIYFPHSVCRLITCVIRILPLQELQFARGRFFFHTAVKKICNSQNGNGCSDHDAPPVCLSIDVFLKFNHYVTSNKFVRLVSFKISQIQIFAPFISVFSHDINFKVWFLWFVFISYKNNMTAKWKYNTG